MAAFHQMGHDSQNLLPEVHGYVGAITSPVDDPPDKLAAHIARHRSFEFLFDPMLYFPRTERMGLREWPYFPSDVETADLSDEAWWHTVVDRVIVSAEQTGASAVCSPVTVPGAYSNDYYALVTEVGNRTVRRSGKLKVWQTLLVRLPELTTARAMEIASIVSRTKAVGIYLIFVKDLEPRREYRDIDSLRAGIKLIRALKSAGVRSLVGFCGSEMVLWKAAGAFACATGKFFNLRRFTKGRFEIGKGGGQLPYWFEESLMAWLREPDLRRVNAQGLLSEASMRNPWGREILRLLKDEPGEPWLALGWRQWMHWFADAEARVGSTVDADQILTTAGIVWERLDEADIILEERNNDGGWVEPWRRALKEKGHTKGAGGA